MLLLRRLILVFSFVAGGVISVRAATNIISGQVTTNSIWSGTNLLIGTVTIQTNIVVTIEPGTQMLMNTGATVIVYGQLLANGATNQPINFTRATTAARWSRIRFVAAADSAFRNCIFEYANCAGDHQAYYDNDCNTNTPPLARTYTEAIVALATHLDVEGCVFRNLVGGAGGNEGDAISIISDDIQVTGPASANVRGCRFEGIGQGVHTRFAYVLVENCVFSNKHGDNDDIDLYGESTPPPLIRRNLFLPGHEDKINPTRCSAVIVENVFIGSDDHGVVLRDRCAPIVMNNVIIDCANACIAVQNQCDAFIANNTLRNSARGIRFFDHTTRRGPPYCLFPGSGRATIVNNVIWDCTTSFELQDSPDTTIDSFADVAYCNVEGGQATASVQPSSTLVWGPGNFNLDPRFVSIAATNFHLLTNSPCIDAGTNLSAVVSNDLDRLPRPLDGNGDGTNAFDIGAYEVLLATADSNGDGIPDGWTWNYGFSPLDPNLASGNADNDAQNNLQEWIADTNPTNELSFFQIMAISNALPMTVYVPSSSNRLYTLSYATNLLDPVTWTNVPGQVDVRGTGGLHGLTDSDSSPPEKYYRVNVEVP
jgi:hypothetical protein